ncbi:MAG: 3-hydroxyacyl-ACP dehydratase FabZ [Cyanobacteria bacterium P01_H01_bin.74]
MTATALTPKNELMIQDILQSLPHRYPFILVDRVTAHEKGKRITGYKNISMNEPFFQGHFPNEPIMPGVLQIEALAQLGVLLLKPLPEAENKLAVFAGINNAKFKKIVVPGDRLDMECTLIKLRTPIGKMQGKAFVDGKLVCEADITCSLLERPNS